MHVRLPRARWRAISFVAACTAVALTLAPPVLACDIAQEQAQPPAPAAVTPPPSSASPASDASPAPSIAPAAKRPRGLLPLFASFAVLQALDVHSTLKAIDSGAVEQNIVMAPVVNRPAAFVAFKIGATAGAIVAADRLAKHNRVAAYTLMFALNSAYLYVVAHNYKVAGR